MVPGPPTKPLARLRIFLRRRACFGPPFTLAMTTDLSPSRGDRKRSMMRLLKLEALARTSRGLVRGAWLHRRRPMLLYVLLTGTAAEAAPTRAGLFTSVPFRRF